MYKMTILGSGAAPGVPAIAIGWGRCDPNNPKNCRTRTTVYLEYNKDGYKVKPKVKKDDEIEVNKIVFVSPKLTEKLLKKKINNKISKLLLELNTTYDDEEDSGIGRFRNMYLEAEKLYKNLIKTKIYKIFYEHLDLLSLTLQLLNLFLNE